MPPPDQAPVFHDPGRRRWPVFRAGLYALSALASVLLVVFVASVLSAPSLNRPDLRPFLGLPRNIAVRPPPPPPRPSAPPPSVSPRFVRSLEVLRRARARHQYGRGRRPEQMVVAPPSPAPPPSPLAPSSQAPPGAPPGAPPRAPLAAAFYVNWDDSSYASLRRNLDHLDWLLPAWASLRRGADPVRVALDPRALDLVRRERPATRILPMIQNYHDGAWDAGLLGAVVADDALRAGLVAGLARLVETQAFAGVVVDFESVAAADHPALLRFMQELRAAFRPRGWRVAMAVPFDDSDWDYRAYAAAADYLLLMAYDQHWSAGDPGPIAAQDWFDRTLAARLVDLDPGRTIVCVGGYGYDWRDGGAEAESLTFQQAMLAARDARATITFDPGERNPAFAYRGDNGVRHQVWFLDAVTAWNELRAGSARGVAGYALWRLGSEDPSLWRVFGAGHAALPAAPPAALGAIEFPYDVDFVGTGEILQLEAEPHEGRRVATLDASGAAGPADLGVTAERYDALPTAYVVRRTGDRAGLVALTFDDGPDPVWTPRVLDILKREGVRASFFIIGENGYDHPDLVRRIYAEGHNLGNHSYTHPNLGEVPPLVVEYELNATQRLIEALTGHSTVLFRPPYFGDAEPTTPEEVAPLAISQRLGYVTVGLRIDPDDWATPGTAEVLRRTLAGASETDPERRGNIVLLHDAGGDRAETVAALPGIIRGLRARGLRIVPVSELAGLGRARAMPPATTSERRYSLSNFLWIYGGANVVWLLHWLLLLGLALGFGRIAFVTALAVAEKVVAVRRRARLPPPGAAPARVSVLVPAFNEAKVIARTIESLLAQTYPDFEILVVDDGSTDDTAAVVRARFGAEPRVRLFTKPNGGKADSLNFGLREASGRVVVALDADTIFPPDVLVELTRDFDDPRVGAVAGNAKVGNRINLVTRWQALEYITSQNLDRRAFALLNCITVVPGAVGAWRRDVLTEVGGFTSDTLAEDQDTTLAVLRRGWRIAYAERAVAWTEAPDTLRGLAKQRFRWSFGTLQCMWKHRGALLRPRYGALGFVGMPNVWLFQVVFTLLAPLMDLLLLRTVLWVELDRIEHPGVGVLAQLGTVLFYYALFLGIDLLSAAVAFALERGEQWSLLGWLLLQRLCYRQVMYYVMYKSVLTAVRGAVVGWGKLERKATVAASHGGGGP